MPLASVEVVLCLSDEAGGKVLPEVSYGLPAMYDLIRLSFLPCWMGRTVYSLSVGGLCMSSLQVTEMCYCNGAVPSHLVSKAVLT